MKKKPNTKSSGVRITGVPVNSVTSQENICKPLGIAIVMLMMVKKLAPISGRPVANM